ncbi:23S rRNA pseudouridine synthase F [Mammaliicoccus lentus]|jgi:23S rRNA pseudouridine2604 synthase|uniref:Pseudouridine synthase n=1 Tax=Mammaliicoccus lentus TaxID=42858 RepID=A0AAX3W7A9_MAMLE|nr:MULTISPECIES: pseudouridine synthase [Mammaliicoccus]HBV03224.1 23S rRNA pseudouridine synthase F [Staphylococcus sp.]MBF0748550.1 pseudouridine synthase [Mammaliicoccus lentus]MBF0795294.1 pseudouridine synthase [Mammaliicoccus lentus]MBW0761931.1 pseudouridine synthase [Mammaliicoccus lentus]MBW0766917.1 pseudouridine synthase [Mammaliicoccus lentus]
MRINKFLSEAGVCSRRGADKWIDDKRVKINDELATLGSQVEDSDVVKVDNKVITIDKGYVYIALNKPRGITSTTEKHIKGNVVDYVNHPERIFHIGRLDKDSEGLLLLTSDGDIVNEILRSENHHEKEYVVTVDKPITKEFIKNMSNGVVILNQKTLPAKLEQLNDKTFKIILTQGLNRQIRRMCETLGYNVKKLKRIRIMNIKLDGIKYGEWRDLTAEEFNTLTQTLSYEPKRERMKSK